ncbi:MAG: DUF4157 domain-containing protein [Syntrophomonas sp.]
MSTAELASRKLGQNASDRLRTSDKKDTFKKQEKNQVKQTEAGGKLLELQSSLGNQAVLGMLDKQGKLEEGSGSLIPESIKGKMEASFGTDFSDVRIHESPNAQAMGARAMTRGSEIFFAPGQFTAATQEGQSLLGHELSHVVQQREGRVEAPQTRSFPLVDSSSLEGEADRQGERASRGISARNTGSENGHVSNSVAQAGAQMSADNAPVQASFFSSLASGAKKAFGAAKKFATSKEGRAMIGGALTIGGAAAGANNPALGAGLTAAGGMVSPGAEAAGAEKDEEEKEAVEERENG